MPDTNAYLLLGLAVVIVIVGGYIGTLLMRFRTAKRDITTLISLREEN